MARNEIEGLTHLIKTYISSAKDVDLSHEDIIVSFTFLSWYIHRFWRSLVRNIIQAAKLIADTYPHLIDKLQDILLYIYDSNWFPENLTTITDIP